jgi:hypothetical protein
MAAWMFPWMAGTMFVPPLQGVKLQDINGVAITVGATVKMVGTVTAVNAIDGHFMNVTVTPNNPTPDAKTTVPKTPVGFHPLQLVVGS